MSTPELYCLPRIANRHLLACLAYYTTLDELHLSCDVFSTTGECILPAETRLSPVLLTKFAGARLARPLEMCLAGAHPWDIDAWATDEAHWYRQIPLLHTLTRQGFAHTSPTELVAHASVAPGAQLLWQVACACLPSFRAHSVLVASFAAGLAAVSARSDPQFIADAALAGMFHDLGELYFASDMLAQGHTFTEPEWAAYAMHPTLGAMLGADVGQFSLALQRGIAEHHERADGFGYPSSLRGHNLSPIGRVLGLAEMLSAVLTKPNPARRARVALMIMPDEFETEIATLLTDTVGATDDAVHDNDVVVAATMTRMHATLERIARCAVAFDGVRAGTPVLSAECHDLVREAYARFARIQSAMTSAGLLGFGPLDDVLDASTPAAVRGEAACVADEIAWRLTHLARMLISNTKTLPPAERAVLAPLITALSS